MNVVLASITTATHTQIQHTKLQQSIKFDWKLTASVGSKLPGYVACYMSPVWFRENEEWWCWRDRLCLGGYVEFWEPSGSCCDTFFHLIHVCWDKDRCHTDMSHAQTNMGLTVKVWHVTGKLNSHILISELVTAWFSVLPRTACLAFLASAHQPRLQASFSKVEAPMGQILYPQKWSWGWGLIHGNWSLIRAPVGALVSFALPEVYHWYI